jgi:RNA polymerase sigma factor (sigma-70 family)
VFQVHADNRTMTPRALFHPARLARRPVLSTQSDERLVDLVRAGSDPAFEAIVERYRRALMRYVSRLLPPERAEDVVQQCFVKAYEAMHRNSAELNLRPWLYRIAHNSALNALRDRGAAHAELSDTIDGVERPDQAFERTLGLRELVVAVQALPDRQRSAILLREMEGRSYEEIAAALGVSDGAVRQLLNRARNSLRAAAAAVMPMPLVERVAASDSTEPVTARVAELVGIGGGALAMKVCATALVTGAVVGGAAVVPDIGREQASRAADADTAHAAEPAGGDSKDPSEDSTEVGERGSGGRGGDSGGREERGGRRDRDSSEDGNSGPRDDRRGESGTGDDGGPGGSEPQDDRSGRRGGGGETDDHSGPGGGGLDSPDDHSGPGGGGGLDSPDDHSGPGGGGGDVIDEPTEAREGSSGPGGGGSSGPGGGGSGSGSGSDDLPDAESLDDSEPDGG